MPTRPRPEWRPHVLVPILALLLAAGLLVALAPPAVAAGPSNDTPPAVTGTLRVGQSVHGTGDTWTPEPDSRSVQWLRDGQPIAGATRRWYRLTPADRGRTLRVRVTATSGGESTTVLSDPVGPVRAGSLTVTRRPHAAGVARWTRQLEVRLGGWKPSPRRFTVRWLRDGRPIPGATGRRFRPRTQDVNRHVRARVTGHRPGWAPTSALTPARRIGYRVPVRRTVTYHVEVRGPISTSVATFKRQAQETFDHARGWRNGGTRFRRVARGGQFTLVLAAPHWLPKFSSGCSVDWSCRVGRYVIINQKRWKYATPSWNAARGSLRGYRHMVVNHEVGHWLGRGHVGCPGRGRLAPVMMQQSKSLGGCRFNPFPTRGEL